MVMTLAARLLAAVVASILVLPAGLSAQQGFRVTYSIARTTPTHVEVAGTVQNDTRAEAMDVSVTVEALAPTGKVAARGITYVTARIPQGGTASFVAKVPAVAGATTYRAVVTSYRFIQAVESP